MTRVLVLQIVFSVLLISGALLFVSGDMAIAIAAGAGLGIADMSLITLFVRAMSARLAGAVRAAVVLSLKFPALIGLLYLLIVTLSMDPVGVALGFSAGISGLLAGLLAAREIAPAPLAERRSAG